jgi:hypothetical protein
MSAESNLRPSTVERTGTGGGELVVEVFSPRYPEPRKFEWPKSLRVGEAAEEAAKAFGYEAGTPTLQTKDGRVLDREKTLLEAGVRDFDQLELTDHGGGV